MKILFVSHGIYPCKIGGAEIFNYYLVKTLAKYHKFTVLTQCGEETGLDATIIKITRRKFGLSRISIPLQDFLVILKLRKYIDLIHITYARDHWMRWLPYPVAKKIFNIPYIITIHGGGLHQWKPVFPHRFLFDNAENIIGISQKIKEEYERRTHREIQYIPPLIPFEECIIDKAELRRTYNLELSDTIFLFVGSIKKIKGCDTLIDAFTGLGDEYVKKNKLKLLLAGDGNLRTSLEENVRQKKFNSHIIFMGNITREHISLIYKLADIYILPSYFEGTPISMLEAMFNGLPIIGSNVRGINNIIKSESNGLLFEVNNSADLKDKIIRIVENSILAKNLALKAKQDYENNYHYNSVLTQYNKIYDNCSLAYRK